MVQKTKPRIMAEEQVLTMDKAGIVDAAIILGAYVRPDGQPSVMLAERLNTGIALYHAGFTNRLLMSGDHGQEEYNEVRIMKDYAIERGVPSDHIFMDHAGFSTYETMYRASYIFEIESAYIVSQEYHLARAVYDADKLGIEGVGVICDRMVYSGDGHRKAREALARGKDFFYGILKPEPTYLGEKVPIKGSGDDTNDEK